jgi:hypothetical protein
VARLSCRAFAEAQFDLRKGFSMAEDSFFLFILGSSIVFDSFYLIKPLFGPAPLLMCGPLPYPAQFLRPEVT